MATKEILQNRRKQSETIRRMVIAAMLGAITAVLVFTPIGMITLPPPLLAVTMVHIPVILAALAEGIWVGLAVGLVFGVCSLIRAWGNGMVGLTLFFRNPLVSVAPRLLIPLVAVGVCFLWKRCVRQTAVTQRIGVGVAAVLGSLTNTVGCLGMVLLLYGKDLNELVHGMVLAGNADAAYSQNAAGWLIAVVGFPNGIAEAIVAAVLVPMLMVATQAVSKRAGRRPGVRQQKGQEP